MIAFATEFPLDHGKDVEQYLECIQTWLIGSPHTELTNAEINRVGEADEVFLERNFETLASIRYRAQDVDSAAIRYIRREPTGLEWTTTAAYSRDPEDTWFGIRIQCESRRPSAALPRAKKPILVRTLLSRLGGGLDGTLPVGGQPIYLSDTDIEGAARIVRGTSGAWLPVVYVSAGFSGESIVDVRQLADYLAGMAHVVVEPNRQFSLRLKLDVAGRNVYGGTVGLYWPDGGGRRAFFLGDEFSSRTEVAQAIVDEVTLALANRRPLERCTWAAVQAAVSHRAMRKLQESGSLEVEKYIQTFDAELRAKDERFQEAEREIGRLKSEVLHYEGRLATGSGTLLNAGTEQELYPDEITCILLDALADASTRLPTDSRREHVISAVIQANQTTRSILESNREKLKELLRGSRGIDPKIRRGLEELGFSISAEGKHYKLIFRGDDRYSFTLPKTGSDHRGGLNAASDISKRLF